MSGKIAENSVDTGLQSIETPPEKKRTGPRTGIKHKGQFQPGPDPRRHRQRSSPEKRALIPLAKEYTYTAFMTLIDVLEDEDSKAADRIKAAGMVLDRGHGQAVSSINIQSLDGGSKALDEMPLDQLKVKVAAMLLEHESSQADNNAIDADFVPVDEPIPAPVSDDTDSTDTNP